MPLHRLGNLCPGKCEPGFRHVDKADNPFDILARLLCGIEVSEFFRNPHDQRTVNARVEQKSLAAGQHATMVGVVDDESIGLESNAGERVENFSNQAIHARTASWYLA